MRILAAGLAMMMLGGCFGAGRAPVDPPVICAATAADRTAHAAALAVDGGPASRRTGRVLIAKLDAGCAD